MVVDGVRPVRVLYNATSARAGGGLSYARSQVESLGGRADIDLTVLVAPWNREDLDAVVAEAGAISRLVKVPNAGVRLTWEQVVLPALARNHDVLISPANFAPTIWCPVPSVMILQNANYVGRGRTMQHNRGLNRRIKILFSHLSMKRATVAIMISNSLQAELQSELSLSRVRSVVVRSGVPDLQADWCDDRSREMVEAAVGPEPYVLAVCNDYPHKRLEDLAGLAGQLPDQDESVPRRVVVAGEISSDRRYTIEQMVPDRSKLVLLGSVTDKELVRALNRHATVVAVTSELEAWGLTLFEATIWGTPLVASDISPHRELADGHASFFPVGDLEVLVAATEASARAGRVRPWTMDRPWSAHGDELEDVLRAVVGSRS